MNVLIIGGSSGLGEAITKRLAINIVDTVYFTYNSSLKNANNIEREFSNTHSLHCDFHNENEVEELIKKISNLDINVLVNNAYSGSFINTYFHKTQPEDFLSSFTLNILPLIKITQAAIIHFRKRKQGKIITILSSALINTPPIGSSVYTANKAYISQLSKIWATENIKFNITSNTVSPSFMQTDFTKEIDERLIEQMRENHPLKKFITPSEVADAVSFLSTASAHINGTNMVLNAGTDFL